MVLVLQPGVVSMHEQSVLTKEEACFWSEEKIGASLSVVFAVVFAVVFGLVRLTTVMVGTQLVIVISVGTVIVVVIASGVLQMFSKVHQSRQPCWGNEMRRERET
jgi:uncharacterized membrane protein YczE